MIKYNGITIGKAVVKQFDRKFTLQIRQGNCLAVILHIAKITEGEHKGMWRHTLYSFYADDKHMGRILKEYGNFFDNLVSIELNMFYKECWTLLKYYTKAGYKVKCYYKEPKKK